MTDVGVIAISERPTRVILSAITLLAIGLHPHAAMLWATLGATAWAGTALIGLGQLTAAVRVGLRNDASSPPDVAR